MSIIENLPSSDYFAYEAASNSGLKLVRQSPAHFKYREPEDYDSRAMEMGNFIHCALLEPDRFASHFLVAKCEDRNGLEYKGLKKDVGSARVMTLTDHKRVIGMQNRAYANTRFKRLMQSNGRNELSVFSVDPETGVPVKCRFDRKLDGMSALDIKKCQDARGSEFVKAISNYGYYMQVAFYQAVWKWETGEDIPEFPLVAIEEKAPHGVVLHDLDELALMLGRKHYREALDTYARCLDSGVWSGYEDESEVTSVTSWAANELMDYDVLGGL